MYLASRILLTKPFRMFVVCSIRLKELILRSSRKHFTRKIRLLLTPGSMDQLMESIAYHSDSLTVKD